MSSTNICAPIYYPINNRYRNTRIFSITLSALLSGNRRNLIGLNLNFVSGFLIYTPFFEQSIHLIAAEPDTCLISLPWRKSWTAANGLYWQKNPNNWSSSPDSLSNVWKVNCRPDVARCSQLILDNNFISAVQMLHYQIFFNTFPDFFEYISFFFYSSSISNTVFIL